MSSLQGQNEKYMYIWNSGLKTIQNRLDDTLTDLLKMSLQNKDQTGSFLLVKVTENSGEW